MEALREPRFGHDEMDIDSTVGLGTLQRWLAMASGKWSLPILDRLADRPVRYNRLLAMLDSVAPKVLTQTLRRLESEGLITSEPVGKTGRVYSLTSRGYQMRNELGPLRRWAAQEAASHRQAAAVSGT